MLNLSHEIGIELSTGAAAPLFCRDTAQPGARISCDTFTDYQSGTIFLPADGSPQELSMGNIVDARGYYLEVHGPAAVRLWLNKPVGDDPDTPGYLLLRPSNPADGSNAAIFTYQDAAVESLHLASPDGMALLGCFAIWGFSQPQASA